MPFNITVRVAVVQQATLLWSSKWSPARNAIQHQCQGGGCPARNLVVVFEVFAGMILWHEAFQGGQMCKDVLQVVCTSVCVLRTSEWKKRFWRFGFRFSDGLPRRQQTRPPLTAGSVGPGSPWGQPLVRGHTVFPVTKGWNMGLS